MREAGCAEVLVGLESPTAAGWLSMTTGILLGSALGLWFWYRLIPVPVRLDDPYSLGRWALILVHVVLIVTGWGLVAASLMADGPALSMGAAYSQHAVKQPFIDVEEKIDRTVGRRTKPAGGLSTVTSYKADIIVDSKSIQTIIKLC